LFSPDYNYEKLEEIFNSKNKVVSLELKTEEDIQSIDQDNILPLFLVDPQKNLIIYTDEQTPNLSVDMHLVYIKMH
jgi:hypothetical protein